MREVLALSERPRRSKTDNAFSSFKRLLDIVFSLLFIAQHMKCCAELVVI